MSFLSENFTEEAIDSLNLFSFANLKDLRLAVFLKPDLKIRLRPIQNDQTISELVYFSEYAELADFVEQKAHYFDAVLVDVAGCEAFGVENLYRICQENLGVPVIAIGDLAEENWNQRIIEVGVTDLIPVHEVSPSHVMRILKYAIVRSRNLEKIRDFEQRHKGIVENATEGIFQTTIEGRYLLANPALAQLYGYTSPEHLIDDLTKIDLQLYVEEGRRARFSELMSKDGFVKNFESRIRRKDGQIIWISENARVVKARDGSPLYYEGFVRDITSEKQHQEQLEFLAQRDHLTGLPNRLLYQDRLSTAIDEAQKTGERFALFFIDLDDFKKINDTMGHPAGDSVLESVALRLLNILGPNDTVARLSGDEFTILMRSVKNQTAATKAAEKIMDALKEPFQIQSRQIFTSGSIGICLYPDNGKTISELMQNVDTAAYHAKKLGRNVYRFYTEHLSQQALRRLEIENGLRSALENDEFELAFQPKVSLKTSQIIGSEALLRWHPPGLSPVRPDEFIPVAEDTGLIVPIGKWVMRQACLQQKQWMDQGLKPGTVAINLSAHQFHQKDLFQTIQSVLEETGLPGEYLELELTESALVEHVFDAIEVLESVAVLGVKASVDDFGTGYSSLSYLKKFPISTLKIDRSFVMEIPEDAEDMAIVRAIISLGQSLDLKIVAEGIENNAQSTFLKALNCTYGQGFAYSKPLTVEDYQLLLECEAPLKCVDVEKTRP